MAPSKNIDGKQGAVTKLQFFPMFLLIVLHTAAGSTACCCTADSLGPLSALFFFFPNNIHYLVQTTESLMIKMPDRAPAYC